MWGRRRIGFLALTILTVGLPTVAVAQAAELSLTVPALTASRTRAIGSLELRNASSPAASATVTDVQTRVLFAQAGTTALTPLAARTGFTPTFGPGIQVGPGGTATFSFVVEYAAPTSATHVVVEFKVAATLGNRTASVTTQRKAAVLATVEVRLAGTVTDTEQALVEGVTIAVRDLTAPGPTVTATTGEDGQFLTGGLGVSPLDRLLVDYQKEGFTVFQRTLLVQEGGTLYSNAVLKAVDTTSALDAGTGGTVGAVDGTGGVTAQVDIAGGSVLGPDGRPFSGPVVVSVTALDPAAEAAAFPGDFLASSTRSADANLLLESFGLMDITITDGSGARLTRFDPAKPALLTVRLPDPFQAGGAMAGRVRAGDRIPWWSFDETLGIWVREDATPATRGREDAEVISVGGVLFGRGGILHASWWNVDQSLTHASIWGRVLDPKDGNPVPGLAVRGIGVTYSGSSSDTTDTQGRFCLTVKRSEAGATERVKVAVSTGTNPDLYFRTVAPAPDSQKATTAAGQAAEVTSPTQEVSCAREGHAAIPRAKYIGALRPPLLKAKAISFLDDHTVRNDTPASFVDIADPVWKDDNLDGVTEKSEPIAYSRSGNGKDRPKAAVEFKIDPAVEPAAPIDGARIMGDGPDSTATGMAFDLDLALNAAGSPATASLAGDTVTSELVAEGRTPRAVEAFTPMDVAWKVCYWNCGTPTNFYEGNRSQHRAYVTLADPVSSGRVFLSLLDITSVAAKGATAADGSGQAVAKIFGVFQSLSAAGTPAAGPITKKVLDSQTGSLTNGMQLRYWTPWTLTAALDRTYSCPAIFSTEEILRVGVGRCGGWAPFLIDALAMHGIVSEKKRVGDLPGFPTGPAGSQLMLINHWSFAGAGTSGDASFPFEMSARMSRTFAGGVLGPTPGTATTFTKREFDDRPGAPGQGNANPPGYFAVGDHAVTVYQGRIYDPSYGTGPFPDIRAWANASLAGYVKTSQTVTPDPANPSKVTITIRFLAHRGVP